MFEKGVFEKKNPNEELEVVDVDMNEWKVVESGMIGETTGLGPCFGIILYDTESKKALVGHFPDPRTDLNHLLAESARLFSDPKKVRAYVGGGAVIPNDTHDYEDHKRVRRFVQEKLEEAGFENPHIDYHTSSDTTDMRIDTRTGAVTYETIPDDDYGDTDGDDASL